ncbi:MAG: glycosyltransferase family 39 protein [Lachnospiraceae bacterium]|nr:glycosyltransferase family 39 protein [Lachnospiraceae bacterium]
MYYIFKYASLIIVSIFCLISYLSNKKLANNKQINADSPIIKLYNTCIYLLDKYWMIALLCIFAVFLFTRFFAIEAIPAGVHLDEVGYWIDAQSLAKFGTDRLGNRYPWLPVAYGDGHSPLYTYMCVVVLKFFPFSVKLMRQVMAVSSIPCFFAAFGIVYQLYENRRFALLGPIFVTITPYVFSASRWGLNAYQMLFVCTIALYFMMRALKYGKTRDYVFLGIFMGLTLIAYILAFIMMPVFFVLFFAYLLIVKEFKFKNMIATFIPCLLIGFPTFLEQLVNIGIIKPFYFLGSDYQKLGNYRIGELALGNIFRNLGNIVPVIFGDNKYNYNSIGEFGTIYWASIPLFVLGSVIGFIVLYKSVKNRKLNLLAPVVLFSFSVYFGFLFDSGCNTYKVNPIYIAFILLIIAGLRYISGYSIDECSCGKSDKITKESTDDTKINISCLVSKSLVISTLAVLALSFLLYTNFYFRHMTATYGFPALFFSTAPGDVIKYEESMYNPNGEKPVYLELNYENRTYGEWIIAMCLEMDPKVFSDYVELREQTPDEERNFLTLDHYTFAFPETFDIDEDAVYILGYEWNHISDYLTSVGFSCDTSYPGYRILYR